MPGQHLIGHFPEVPGTGLASQPFRGQHGTQRESLPVIGFMAQLDAICATGGCNDMEAAVVAFATGFNGNLRAGMRRKQNLA